MALDFDTRQRVRESERETEKKRERVRERERVLLSSGESLCSRLSEKISKLATTTTTKKKAE